MNAVSLAGLVVKPSNRMTPGAQLHVRVTRSGVNLRIEGSGVITVNPRTLLDALAAAGVDPERLFFLPCGHEADMAAVQFENEALTKQLATVREALA